MVPYKENKILLSTGEYRFRDLAQDAGNVFGKIISIDLRSKEYLITTMAKH